MKKLSMLRHYMGDWRSLLPGGSAGIMQLMYPPLGAAVAMQCGVNMNPVTKDYTAFEAKFGAICRNTLELTPAAARTLEMGLEGKWRLPLTQNNFKSPSFRRFGRVVLLGTLPKIVRHHFDVPWNMVNEIRFKRSTMRFALRFIGSETRKDRYQPRAAKS